MTETRTVVATIRDPQGKPIAGYPISFTATQQTTDHNDTYVNDSLVVRTDEEGRVELQLVVGLTYKVGLVGSYKETFGGVTHPEGTDFEVTIPRGGVPISLEQLRNTKKLENHSDELVGRIEKTILGFLKQYRDTPQVQQMFRQPSAPLGIDDIEGLREALTELTEQKKGGRSNGDDQTRRQQVFSVYPKPSRQP